MWPFILHLVVYIVNVIIGPALIAVTYPPSKPLLPTPRILLSFAFSDHFKIIPKKGVKSLFLIPAEE